jgi:hypothetical protein
MGKEPATPGPIGLWPGAGPALAIAASMRARPPSPKIAWMTSGAPIDDRRVQPLASCIDRLATGSLRTHRCLTSWHVTPQTMARRGGRWLVLYRPLQHRAPGPEGQRGALGELPPPTG